MDTSQLIRKLVKRLKKTKFFIPLVGILIAGLVYYQAKKIPVTYTSMATLYPLTTGGNNIGGNYFAALAGSSTNFDANLSKEAMVSIEEIAKSRTTREKIALQRLPEFGNKRVAELLIESENKYHTLKLPFLETPKDTVDLAILGYDLLNSGINISFNKTGLMIITFTNADSRLLTPVSYVIIETVTDFFTNLTIQKARSDYRFTVKKLDSLKDEIAVYDRRAIRLNNTTRFTNESKIEYTIPKEEIINNKTRLVSMYNGAFNNREEALWRLQKTTPVISMLDYPTKPFDVVRPAVRTYAIIGFIVGCLLALILFTSDILYKFLTGTVSGMITDLQYPDEALAKEAEVIQEDDAVTTTL